MRQRTAKSLIEALAWIHTQPHHEIGIDYGKDGMVIARYFKNHHEKFRVKIYAEFWYELQMYIEPNQRPFDTRAYALTPIGKKVLFKREPHLRNKRYP